jgi:hypothetical protein
MIGPVADFFRPGMLVFLDNAGVVFGHRGERGQTGLRASPPGQAIEIEARDLVTDHDAAVGQTLEILLTAEVDFATVRIDRVVEIDF